MDLKILMLILMYYSAITVIILSGGATLDGATLDGTVDNSPLSESEVTTGGIFGSGISFTRFTGLITIGVGLPDSTADWFKLLAMVWQTTWLLFTIGFIISAIWNG